MGEGHQDEGETKAPLSPLAKLNIEMDELAASVHSRSFGKHSTADQEVLPAELWAVYLGSEKVTTKLKDTIVHCCHSLEMREYIGRKHNLSEFDMDHITWAALHSYTRKQPMA